MEQDAKKSMKRVNGNVVWNIAFAIINNIGMMINEGVNAKN